MISTTFIRIMHSNNIKKFNTKIQVINESYHVESYIRLILDKTTRWGQRLKTKSNPTSYKRKNLLQIAILQYISKCWQTISQKINLNKTSNRKSSPRLISTTAYTNMWFWYEYVQVMLIYLNIKPRLPLGSNSCSLMRIIFSHLNQISHSSTTAYLEFWSSSEVWQ